MDVNKLQIPSFQRKLVKISSRDVEEQQAKGVDSVQRDLHDSGLEAFGTPRKSSSDWFVDSESVLVPLTNEKT